MEKTQVVTGCSSFSLRAYRPDDAEEATQLFKRCFKVERLSLEWKWKFGQLTTNPQAPFPIAEADGRLVGIYPGLTLRLQMDTSVQLIAVIVDSCVDPRYRGGTILQAMSTFYAGSTRTNGIPLWIGFPTGRHYKFGELKLGYRELFRLWVWRRPLTRGLRLQMRIHSENMRKIVYRAGSLCQDAIIIRRKKRYRRDITIAGMQTFDKSVNQLWERTRSQVLFAVARDAAYLNWRYHERPGNLFTILGALRNGQLLGYCVFRDNLVQPDGVRIGVLMDFLATEPSIAYQLVESALSRMRSARCGYALALLHPEMITAPVLTSLGFIPDEASKKEVIFTCKLIAPDVINIQMLRQPSNWHLAYGDTDHMG